MRLRNRPSFLGALLAFLGSAGLLGCGPTERIHRYRQVVMGTEASVSIVAADEATAQAGAAAAFARLNAIEDVLSDYRADSEAMRLVATVDRPVAVSAELMEVLMTAEAIRSATDGAFDVTVGPLTALWRETRRSGVPPSEEAIAAARSAVGPGLLVLDAGADTVTVLRPGMRLDFGGIGKGYAAAEAVATLRELGLPRSLVAIAGDIAAGDPPPGRIAWTVDLEWPDGTRTQRLVARQSISTSGDRMQWTMVDGVRRSHIIDPRTGYGATDSVQVTVQGPDGATVDALATALSLAGPSSRPALSERFPLYWFAFPAEP